MEGLRAEEQKIGRWLHVHLWVVFVAVAAVVALVFAWREVPAWHDKVIVYELGALFAVAGGVLVLAYEAVEHRWKL